MRFFRVCALVGSLLSFVVGLMPMHGIMAQATDSAIAVSVAIPGSAAQSFEGHYLGHGLLLTHWPAATLYGLQNSGKEPKAPFVSPRHRLSHYLVPLATDPANLDYAAFDFVLCGDNWQLASDSTAKDCLPFGLAPLTTVQRGSEPAVSVKQLLYADQASDVALLELTTTPDWPAERLANAKKVSDSTAIAAPWLNDVYAAFVNRTDTALAALLTDSLIEPVLGNPSLGDPTTPELGNTGYDVTHYDLDLHFGANNVSLTAKATLDLQITYPQLSGFYLDFSTLTVKTVLIDGAPAKFRQDGQAQKLLITPAKPLTYGQKVQVAISYGGILHAFRSRYMPFLPTGLFVDISTRRVFDVDEPDGAHSWFPCNDQPLSRATYTFHISTANDLTAVANGQQQGAPVDNGDGTHTFTWVMPQTMPTYLAVIAIANYVATPLPNGPENVALTAYSYADSPMGDTFDLTGPIMKLEIARFGPFPFASYGQVLVPQDSVGMESATMTVMFDGLPNVSPDTIYFFIAHEMAHHWFGDSVTLSTWGDIWLNEGFASYAEYTIFSDSGNQQAAANTLADWKHAMTKTVNSQAITHLSADNLFGNEAYDKAGYVLHMLREKIGDDAFFKTLQTYAARFAYGHGTTDRFWATAEAISGQDLSTFFSEWLTRVDIPRVDVSWTEANGQLSVLACARTSAAQAFDFDLPLVFSTAPDPNAPAQSTPDKSGQTSAKRQEQTDSEQLHLKQSSGSAQFALPFDAQSAKADPTDTVMVDAQVRHVDALPSTCPRPGDGSGQ